MLDELDEAQVRALAETELRRRQTSRERLIKMNKTPEMRKLASEANQGKVVSEETKRKLSEAGKAAWERRRQAKEKHPAEAVLGEANKLVNETRIEAADRIRKERIANAKTDKERQYLERLQRKADKRKRQREGANDGTPG